MRNKLCLLIVFLLITFSTQAQFAIRYQVAPPKPADSLDIAYYSKKNGWGAAAQNFTLNMTIWGFDRFIMKEDFAYVNMHTIKRNLSHSFVWDNDQMGTNMSNL